MREYYIASCSCGKDSLAMVLRLIEEGKPLDEISASLLESLMRFTMDSSETIQKSLYGF